MTTPRRAWSPAQGPDPLHRRYRLFLMNRYGNVDRLNSSWGTTYASVDEVEFGPVMPDGAAEAEDWRIFVGTAIGFTYAAVRGVGDEGAYQRFLERRYRRVKAFAAASPHYASLGVSSFRDVRLPSRLPPPGRALVDWIHLPRSTSPRSHGPTGLRCSYRSSAKWARRRASESSDVGRRWVGPDPEVVSGSSSWKNQLIPSLKSGPTGRCFAWARLAWGSTRSLGRAAGWARPSSVRALWASSTWRTPIRGTSKNEWSLGATASYSLRRT